MTAPMTAEALAYYQGLPTPDLRELRDYLCGQVTQFEREHDALTLKANGKPKKLTAGAMEKANELANNLDAVRSNRDAVRQVIDQRDEEEDALAALAAETQTPDVDVEPDVDVDPDVGVDEPDDNGPTCAECQGAISIGETSYQMDDMAEVHEACVDAYAVKLAARPAPQPDPEPEAPKPTRASATPPAGAMVTLDATPTLADAARCATCDEPMSTRRPYQTADGALHHKLCATAPEAAWRPEVDYSSQPVGSMLDTTGLEGVPTCWGCKLVWKAGSKAIVASNGRLYHKLCADWAEMLPKVARAPRTLANEPRVVRASASTTPTMAARIAALEATVFAQAVQIASLTAALIAGGLMAAPTAPEAAPEPEASDSAPETTPEAPAPETAPDVPPTPEASAAA